MKMKLFEINEQTIQKVQMIYVFGDLHGDYYPFSNYLKTIDLETNLVIFLGDYADRGKYGMETLYTIDHLITKFPEKVIALKGNHEDYVEDGIPFFSPCDLLEEVREKHENWRSYYKSFLSPFIEKLYLSAILPGQMLFVHGGISSKINSLEDLINPSIEIERDILWSDPIEINPNCDDLNEYENFRGSGVLFSKTITEKLLNLCGVKYIVRSHQPRSTINGICFNHDNTVITINSTSVYDTKPAVFIINPAHAFSYKTEFI